MNWGPPDSRYMSSLSGSLRRTAVSLDPKFTLFEPGLGKDRVLLKTPSNCTLSSAQ